MAANSAVRSRVEADEPLSQPSQRSWKQNVPYDMIDQRDTVERMVPPERARRPAGTQHLQAMPGVRETTTYRPASAPAQAAAPVYRPHAAARPADAKALRMFVCVLAAAAAAVVLYLVVSSLVAFTQTKIDDMKYGNPRTTHLDAVVGNGDSADQPTHFIALNLNRQVSVIELPGGDISKATAISGPYLFGDGEDLTPVQLRVEDINGDGKPDLLLTVKNEEIAYINDKGSFRPITADEKAKVEQAAAPPAAK